MSKWLNNKKKVWKFNQVPKPCHKLKFCPYGQLIEEFPCHNEAEKYAIKHNKFVKMTKDKGWTECKRTERGATPDVNWACTKIKEPFSCKTFGHDCPVYYQAEERVE